MEHCAKPERDGVLQRLHAPVHGELRRDGPRGRERAGVTGFPAGRLQRSVERPLCKDAYDTYRGFQRFKDETLWNYEVGLKSSYEKVTLNGRCSMPTSSNLGVNVDAGRLFIACGHQRARSAYHGRGTGVRRAPHGCLAGDVCRQLRGGGIRFHGSRHGQWGRD